MATWIVCNDPSWPAAAPLDALAGRSGDVLADVIAEAPRRRHRLARLARLFAVLEDAVLVAGDGADSADGVGADAVSGDHHGNDRRLAAMARAADDHAPPRC